MKNITDNLQFYFQILGNLKLTNVDNMETEK